MQSESLATIELGTLARVGLHQVWEVEHQSFTPWLAAHLDLLGAAIDIPLSLRGQETDIGTFRADILAKGTTTGQTALIENQLERTDHTHLGQLITYAAGIKASVVIWIADTFTDEHRAALDWLTESTTDSIQFFGVEIELWHIGESQIAPRFNVVSASHAWTRTVTRTVAPPVGSKQAPTDEKRGSHMEHRPTMDNIRSEAIALEFDVHTDEGFLDITKRGDPSLFYRSLYPYDDPRVLSYAYQWLLQYRAYLEQTDQARRELTQHPRSKTNTIAALIRMTVITGAVCWQYASMALNNWENQATIWYIGILLSTLAWTGFCLLQIHKYRKSLHQENIWRGKL